MASRPDSRPHERTPKHRIDLRSVLVTQAIAIVCFVAVPVVITLMVPFTDLEFRKDGGAPSVGITRYVLVFVPWQERTVRNVREVRADITAEKHYANTSENRRKGRTGATSYATGQLTIIGDGPERIAQASPELATETETRFRAFAASDQTGPVEVRLYASWRLSWLLGGAVTFLCGFYLLGCALAIVRFLYRLARGRVTF